MAAEARKEREAGESKAAELAAALRAEGERAAALEDKVRRGEVERARAADEARRERGEAEERLAELGASLRVEAERTAALEKEVGSAQEERDRLTARVAAMGETIVAARRELSQARDHTEEVSREAERAQAALTADLRAREGELRDRAEQLAAEAGARAREREAAARGMRELEARVLASVRADFEAAARDSQI